MKKRTERLREIVSLASVIVHIDTDDVERAVLVANILAEAGLPVMEVGVRNKASLEIVEKITKAVPGAIVGAGSVSSAAMMIDCAEVGAQWIASPGTTQNLLMGFKKVDVPFLPGIATPSEAMGLASEGFDTFRFFPAEALGGAAFVARMAASLHDLWLCPIGGITPETAPAYLALPNVPSVGSTWVVPREALVSGDMNRIADLAAEAALL